MCFFFKQKTAYEMRISDWSSDVCSSDLTRRATVAGRATGVPAAEVGWSEILAVFAFARLATAVPFSPGGLRVVELALTTGLAAAGGTRAPVVAAVLVYRALTYLLQIPLDRKSTRLNSSH